MMQLYSGFCSAASNLACLTLPFGGLFLLEGQYQKT
jgi:hypothetical protein